MPASGALRRLHQALEASIPDLLVGSQTVLGLVPSFRVLLAKQLALVLSSKLFLLDCEEGYIRLEKL